MRLVLLAQEMRDWQSFAELTDAVPGLRPVWSFPNNDGRFADNVIDLMIEGAFTTHGKGELRKSA